LSNQTITISIIDNGSGIEASLCDKLFEPFFSTKAIGKGTGRGVEGKWQEGAVPGLLQAAQTLQVF